MSEEVPVSSQEAANETSDAPSTKDLNQQMNADLPNSLQSSGASGDLPKETNNTSAEDLSNNPNDLGVEHKSLDNEARLQQLEKEHETLK